MGLQVFHLIAACAVVSDLPWVRMVSQVAGLSIPAPVRVFPLDRRDEAVAWLAAVTDGPLISTRTTPERGVVVVEIDRPLRIPDIDALSGVIDEALLTHREVPGLVLHAPGVPGWENLPALWRHLGFVAGHQHRVRRLALVVDGLLPAAGAIVVDHTLHPDVRSFAYSDLDDAVTWAGAGYRRARRGSVPAGRDFRPCRRAASRASLSRSRTGGGRCPGSW